MPQRDTPGIGERVPRELIDADFAIAFSLVDMARDEFGRGNGQLASQLLQKAARMRDDVRGRLQRMTTAQKEAFEQRCVELGQAIESTRPPNLTGA
jgi:hypothetical protein